MNRIYYNPKVYTPIKHIDRVEELLPTDHFYDFEKKRAYASKEEALKENFNGPICYWDNGKLMSGGLYPEWLYEICPDNGAVDWGINWGDIIGLTKEVVAAKYKEMFKSCELDESHIRYDEELGVYQVHVHYDGRL